MTLPNTGPVQFAGPAGATASRGRQTSGPAGPVEVLTYYFPQWHADPRNDLIHAPGWTEWRVVDAAEPRFPGHQQPKRPAWGRTDESDPADAGRAVAAALDHGIDGFIVDWYWYDNQPFLSGALDNGLLHAQRIDEFKFALMWANHEWTDLYPATSTAPATLLPAPNSVYHARCAFRHVIERYFTHPSYWRIDGAAYFSIYDLPGFVRGMGGPQAAAALLSEFRAAAASAGCGELHLNGAVNFQIADPAALAEELGLDSVTHYTWWHHPDAGFDTFPTTLYPRVHERAREVWRTFDQLPVRYLPNVTMGWDPSPRTVAWDMQREVGYPFTSILVDNTPDALGQAIAEAVELVSHRPSGRVVTINAWNEWSEGSYLEPDQQHGFGYLEAIRTAVTAAQAQLTVQGTDS